MPHAHKAPGIQAGVGTDTLTDTPTSRQTDKLTVTARYAAAALQRWTCPGTGSCWNGHTDRHTDKQTGRQTHSPRDVCSSSVTKVDVPGHR